MKKIIISLAKTLLLTIGCVNESKGKSYMVYYHDVHQDNGERHTDMSTTMSDFIKHIKVIKSLGYDIVRSFSGKPGEIRIAFDDGFRGIYEIKSYFIDNNIPATIFVPTSLIGKEHYLNEKEIKELESEGFNIQSHGVSHSDMSNMTDEVLKDDLLQSKVMLGNLLDKEIEEVCFPMGYFSDKVIRYAKESGYKLLFSSMPDPKDFANELRGRLFFQTLNPLQVKLSLKGGMSILQNHYQGLHYRKN